MTGRGARIGEPGIREGTAPGLRHLACLFLVLLVACQGRSTHRWERDKTTLGIVGRYAVSLGDFQEFLTDNRARSDAQDDLKSRLWDRLVEEVLVLNDVLPEAGTSEVVPLSRAGSIQQRRDAVDLVLQKQVYSKVRVTEAMVQQYYREHPSEFRKGRGYLLRQILVPTKALAEEARGLLAKNHSFEDVARLYSVSPDRGTAQYFEDGELPEYLAQVFGKMAAGDLSPSLNVAADTFQVVRIEKRLDSYVLPFEEVSARIRLQLADASGEALYRQYLESLRSRYRVTLFPQKFPFRYQKEIP